MLTKRERLVLLSRTEPTGRGSTYTLNPGESDCTTIRTDDDVVDHTYTNVPIPLIKKRHRKPSPPRLKRKTRRGRGTKLQSTNSRLYEL